MKNSDSYLQYLWAIRGILCRIRARRLQELKQKYDEQQNWISKGHGAYREIVQDEFLHEVTSSPFVAVHFYHRDFERCKIMDKHLAKLAPRHMACKFLKLNAEQAPFFVAKLAIRVLPSIVCFQDGVALPLRIIGFEGLVHDEDDAQGMTLSRCSSQHASSMHDFPTTAVSHWDGIVPIDMAREIMCTNILLFFYL